LRREHALTAAAGAADRSGTLDKERSMSHPTLQLLSSDAARIEDRLNRLSAADRSSRSAAGRQQPEADANGTPGRMTPAEFDARMQDAKSRALALREEAIDDLWSRLIARVQSLWQALRSAAATPRREREAANGCAEAERVTA
jgi:hypothetical protein